MDKFSDSNLSNFTLIYDNTNFITHVDFLQFLELKLQQYINYLIPQSHMLFDLFNIT